MHTLGIEQQTHVKQLLGAGSVRTSEQTNTGKGEAGINLGRELWAETAVKTQGQREEKKRRSAVMECETLGRWGTSQAQWASLTPSASEAEAGGSQISRQACAT